MTGPGSASPARDGVRVSIREEADVAVARLAVRTVAHGRLGAVAIEQLATAVSEIARNIVVHARGGGELQVRPAESRGRPGVEVVARDGAPGIEDVDRAMQPGYSTARTLGLGLGSARGLVDEFDLQSAPGSGTTVTMKKWAR